METLKIILGLTMLVVGIAGLVFSISIFFTPSSIWKRNHDLTRKINDGIYIKNNDLIANTFSYDERNGELVQGQMLTTEAIIGHETK
jgi:hypothetical protein